MKFTALTRVFDSVQMDIWSCLWTAVPERAERWHCGGSWVGRGTWLQLGHSGRSEDINIALSVCFWFLNLPVVFNRTNFVSKAGNVKVTGRNIRFVFVGFCSSRPCKLHSVAMLAVIASQHMLPSAYSCLLKS